MHVVIIIGAGEVGTSIAASLASDHEVVVIDVDPDRADQLKYELDVLTIAGDGTASEIQTAANVGRADMVIACTDNDQTNLVACGTAKTLGDGFTIARVKSTDFLRTWEGSEGAFGVDFMVCTDLLTAENIVRVIGLPAAIDVDPFASGLVQMAEFEIDEESPVAGQTVLEADRFESLTFVGLFRDGEMTIPRGDTGIEAGDRAVVIGSPESVKRSRPTSRPIRPRSRRRDRRRRWDRDRVSDRPTTRRTRLQAAADRAGDRPRAVARGESPEYGRDGTRRHGHRVSLPRACRRRGHSRHRAPVRREEPARLRARQTARGRPRYRGRGQPDYVTVFEEIGIDRYRDQPRTVTAEEITRFTYESVAENIAVLENDQAEVLELELTEGCGLTGRPISEIVADTDARFVIGAITRDHKLVTPRRHRAPSR